MRLDRLDLTRYGRFTDHRLDFGEPRTGQPDLHVIYGPNEAGKSTTLSAFLDLLFGIETRSGYDFLHPYATMRIGAALRLKDGVQDFVRIKRPQNSLLDHNEQPVAGAAILAELGGIDREGYRSMFSLDDKKLEEGGQSILASKGDLGQLLFSASAGLADLSQGLLAIEAEAHAFYRFKARGGVLAELKKRLVDLKTDRDAIDMMASDYARLVQDRDAVARQYEDTIAARGRVQARMDEIQRQLNALPRLLALRSRRERLAPLAGLPEAPRGWAEQLLRLHKAEIELDVGLAALAREIDQGVAAFEAMTVDDVALGLAERVAGLGDARARYVTADKDLPDRRLRLRDADGEISGLLQRLERDGEFEPRRLILGASVTGRLRGLIEARSGVAAALTSAATEGASARIRFDEAQAALRDEAAEQSAEVGGAAAFVTLAAAVATVRGDDSSARARLAARTAEAARENLADRLRILQPWTGGADALLDLHVPEPETITRWTMTTIETRKAIERHAGEVERLETERRRLDAERKAIGAVAGVVTDQEAADVRAAREQAWAAHRRRLDADTAEAFESALRHDDSVTGGRFGHMADLVTLHQVSQAMATAVAAADRAGELRDKATAALRANEEEIARAVAAMAPALAGTLLPGLEVWRRQREEALRARDGLRKAERDLDDAEADAARARERLLSALAGTGIDAESDAAMETLLAQAQARIDRETQRRALCAARDERQRDLAARERALTQAKADDQVWGEAWAKACAGSWLGEGGLPSLETVREILPLLADLGAAIEKRSGLADRVGKMEYDQAAFQADIGLLAAELGLEASIAVRECVRTIDRRIEAAQAQRVRRDGEARKLADLRERRRALAEAWDVHRRQADAMTAHFGVETLADVGRKLADIERRDEGRRQVEEAERDILLALRPLTLHEAEQALDAVDQPALEAEIAVLKTRFQDQDQRCHELFSSHSKAVDRVAAIGGDGKVAEIEERRRTTLLEIEEGARHYLALRAGIVAAESALRAYRESHRSSMLETASRAFFTISRGAYKELTTQPDKDGETLIAVPAGGGSKHAAELSKGTRFQLYLALRVAGYGEFAKNRRPVPFIADDIMESFDDFRAEEAFRLFTGMAASGQVIYLTHHRHLCDIARVVCPGVTIHEIGP